MILNPDQFQELKSALLSAFPSQSDLKQMVYFQLSQNLDVIVSGGNMNDMVFSLIQWAEKEGRTMELINGARKTNLGNHALKAFTDNFVPAAPTDNTSSNSSPTGSNAPSSPVPSPQAPTDPEVFVSYAWGGDSEAIVDQLEAAFADKGITLVRDKSSVGYKDRIRDFMRRLGQGNAVVAIISKKFLESEYCMFELLEIADHGEFVDRIFPIVLSDAEIYNPVKRLRYIKYWEDKTNELDEAIRSVSSANLQGFRESIDLYTKIRATFAEQVDILADMNAWTPEMHRDNDFSTLIDAVSKKLGNA